MRCGRVTRYAFPLIQSQCQPSDPRPQTNLKGPMVAANAFLPTANPTHAAILGVTTGTAALPTGMFPGLSAYIGSKFALIKFLEFLASENPNIFVASLHPGMVETDIFRASGATPDVLPMDTGQFHLRINFKFYSLITFFSSTPCPFPRVASQSRGCISQRTIGMGELGCG